MRGVGSCISLTRTEPAVIYGKAYKYVGTLIPEEHDIESTMGFGSSSRVFHRELYAYPSPTPSHTEKWPNSVFGPKIYAISRNVCKNNFLIFSLN